MSCDHSLVGKDCFCCSSVSKSCLILSDPKDCSMRGSSVLNYLPEFANSGPLSQFKHLTLCHSLVLLLSVFPSIRFFPVSQLFASDGQSIGTSASVSVLPMNTQGWFPLGLTALISLLVQGTVKSLLQHHNSKASILQCSAFFIVQLADPSICAYWKNHNFDYMPL